RQAINWGTTVSVIGVSLMKKAAKYCLDTPPSLTILDAVMSACDQTSPSRRKGRRLCGAKTRAGGCCQIRAEPGKARCRYHVGKSTGPKTEAGRNRIAEAQRLRWRHYRERDRKDSTS